MLANKEAGERKKKRDEEKKRKIEEKFHRLLAEAEIATNEEILEEAAAV